MFGKLTLQSVQYKDPVIMTALFIVTAIIISTATVITYHKKWTYIWSEWITSVDHKKIGIMYIVLGLIMLFRGFIDAVIMRVQQLFASDGLNLLPSKHYDQVFTAHGVIMIFFVAMPLIIGFMNIIIPLQIGARDVAYPIINSISLWITTSGAILTNISLIVGEFARTGWLAYPPLSELQYSPDSGVDYWIWSLQLSGVGAILSGINFFVTILKMRAPGMSMFKLPIFVWTSLCSNVLIIAAFPVLTATLILLCLDRYFGFCFFTGDLGNPMMYINLIWIWGHPEVYILILPAFGIFSEITATFSRKKLFGYNSLVLATISITVLSFIVWLHHFFTMGAGANVNSFFGIMTMVIAIPTGVKIFNWLFTMYKGTVVMHTCMLWTIGFLITFAIGGMAGVLLSVPGNDFMLHNSLFLVAHFHNVIIGGVVFGIFAGANYWFPKVFGFKLDKTWGIRSFWCWIVGFLTAFMPLYILGIMGMTRRLGQNIDQKFHVLLTIAAIGVSIIALGVVCQFMQIILSIKNKNKNLDNTGDPWDGRTLEWSTSSPPPSYNFLTIPKIKYRDEFWEIKKRGLHKQNLNVINAKKDIIMPKNSAVGIILCIFSSLFGFAAVWHIWWLLTLNLIFIFLVLTLKSCDKNLYYKISVK